MAFFDLPLEALRAYLPERKEPLDFDKFWTQTLEESRQYPLQAKFERVDFGIKTVDVYDVSFNGYQGQSVKGWFFAPRASASDSPLACVVEFIGYGGGRSFPYDWLTWSSCGYAHFVMDTRGQGSDKRHGDTPDLETIAGNSQAPGFMTRGIASPHTYYYRRVFTDAVRAVEAARSFSGVDRTRIAVTGRSQGGGIALAVASLDPSIAVLMPDVPFLCNFPRAVEITDEAPYNEITKFCKTQRHLAEQAFRTLSYFDGMNFAARACARALFSVGLMDPICPPSTVFSAFNHYAGEKDICIWEFNEHEGGESFQVREQVQFLNTLWK